MVQKRHYAQITNTGKKCIVAFMQIPGRSDHCLLIETEALPARWHQPLMAVVESIEGQQETELGNLLGRRIMPDTGRDILKTLHEAGYLQAMPATNVTMYPEPNKPIPLVEITRFFTQTVPDNIVETNMEVLSTEALEKVEDFRPYQTIAGDEQNKSMEITAKNLLAEAELLEFDVKRKREQAYQYAPHLRPKEVLKETKVSKKKEKVAE